ncbi:MAG: hypothetical protein CVU52_07845 [Deltaproteobacteria bacterium HGW-Deltaproteobacteria-10]|nr:MAG: hypothetical protein CVU52_07845 [Deltaproteobacteria bacterium HGW-Deltaproteobacteria-10]PKN86416.1 MAG: hypothetical protein CVU51_07290 [Deltaproteobacteria bacterium HGW-Deltaproteobacteria-1]
MNSWIFADIEDLFVEEDAIRRQQIRKISYQPFASFIPYFVDDSEEKIGSPIAGATYHCLVVGSHRN